MFIPSVKETRLKQANNPSFSDLMGGWMNFIRYPGYPYQTSFGFDVHGRGLTGGDSGNPGGGSGGGNGNTQPPPVTRPPYQWTPPQLLYPQPFGLGADWRETMLNSIYPPNNQGV